MILASLLLAVLLDILLLHPFNQLAHKTFTIGSLINPVMIAIVAGIILFMGFISGLYPAFYLSAFQPVEVLKGQVAKARALSSFAKVWSPFSILLH